MDYTKVDLQRLKAVLCRLIDELATEVGSDSFQLPEADFYWMIDPAAKMRMGKRPNKFNTGRLRDDWEMTYWLADEATKVSAYSLTEVAALLDFMGESVAKTR